MHDRLHDLYTKGKTEILIPVVERFEIKATCIIVRQRFVSPKVGGIVSECLT